MRPLVALVLALTIVSTADAHEVRPAYLSLREERPGVFHVLWKTPMSGDMRLALAPEFSGPVEMLTPVASRSSGNAAVQTWRIRVTDPLRGREIGIAGLDGTMTDVLARIEFLEGGAWVYRFTPQDPVVVIPERPTPQAVAGVYLKLGVEHILLGIDHLLFVFALLLVTRGTARLLRTITAFTIAHSATLALATLGFLRVPSAPVESVIALSIVFVAAEVIHDMRGREGVTSRAPWIVAFAFGLLHGLGFAGALREIGLPQGQIPAALLFFNAGVELGQVAFVGAILAAGALLRHVRVQIPQWAELVPAYAIGSVAMFWVFQRVSAF